MFKLNTIKSVTIMLLIKYERKLMNKLLLIDGNSLLYRAYFGTAYGPSGILKNGDGFPINAILTFTRML